MIFLEQLCLDMMKCAPEEEHNWPTPSIRIKHDAHLFSLSFLQKCHKEESGISGKRQRGDSEGPCGLFQVVHLLISVASSQGISIQELRCTEGLTSSPALQMQP